MSQEIVKWADDAMYEAQPIKQGEKRGPQVYLLSATPDPLGAVAAAMRMFRGDPPYSLADVTDDERRWAWEESIKGHLKAPWEMIDFQFMLEGVSRSFTHQLVRQRTAVYAQESQRFAVKRGMADEAVIPPSIRGNEGAEEIFRAALVDAQHSYDCLVDSGIPAEDARALLPHATATRVIYKTNFRGLMEHAGNRLCTQAQFEWRSVFMGIMRAIREYKADRILPDPLHPGYTLTDKDGAGWQFELIARPIAATFAPVCYKAGHCVFMSELDRGCTIRDRVQAFSAKGVPPDQWGVGHGFGDKDIINEAIDPIHPEEWMADPTAGVTDDVFNPRPD
jgi:flavin-dependent thymidylate synthase